MSILGDIEPKNVFKFFEEICAIPHGSGNVKQLSEYLKKFAKDRKLKVRQEPCGNIIIYKDASAGYEKSLGILKRLPDDTGVIFIRLIGDDVEFFLTGNLRDVIAASEYKINFIDD